MTQTEQILEYLKQGHSITPIEALNAFGCFRLGARIWNLSHGKVDGIHYPIVRDMVKDEHTGKRFAKYYLYAK